MTRARTSKCCLPPVANSVSLGKGSWISDILNKGQQHLALNKFLPNNSCAGQSEKISFGHLIATTYIRMQQCRMLAALRSAVLLRLCSPCCWTRLLIPVETTSIFPLLTATSLLHGDADNALLCIGLVDGLAVRVSIPHRAVMVRQVAREACPVSKTKRSFVRGRPIALEPQLREIFWIRSV